MILAGIILSLDKSFNTAIPFDATIQIGLAVVGAVLLMATTTTG